MKKVNVKIDIKNIHVNSITMVGSLNIGRTLLANNRAKQIETKKPSTSHSNEKKVSEE